MNQYAENLIWMGDQSLNDYSIEDNFKEIYGMTEDEYMAYQSFMNDCMESGEKPLVGCDPTEDIIYHTLYIQNETFTVEDYDDDSFALFHYGMFVKELPSPDEDNAVKEALRYLYAFRK